MEIPRPLWFQRTHPGCLQHRGVTHKWLNTLFNTTGWNKIDFLTSMISVSHFQGQGIRGQNSPPSSVHSAGLFSRLSFCHVLWLNHLKSQVLLCVDFFFCLPLNKYFPSVEFRGEVTFLHGNLPGFFYGHFYIQKPRSRMAWNILVTLLWASVPRIHSAILSPQISCRSNSASYSPWFFCSSGKVHSSSFFSLSSYLYSSQSKAGLVWFSSIWPQRLQQDGQKFGA